MPTQLVKLALIDSSALSTNSAPTIETFSIFQEGAQDASRQVISIEPNTVNVENVRELIESKVYTIDVVGLYTQSKRAQLNTWSKNRTPLYIVGYGLDQSILYGYGAITVLEGFDNNTSFKFRFQNEAGGGYHSTLDIHTASLSYSKNGLALWRFDEAATSTDTPFSANPRLIDPYSSDTGYPTGAGTDPFLNVSDPSAEWTDGAWQVTCDADDVHRFSFYRWFPFAGKTLNFSINVNLKQEGSGVDLFLQTIKETNGSTNLQQETVFIDSSNTTIGSFVRHNVSISSTDSETLYVRAIARTNNNALAAYKEPMIWLGNREPSFIEFNT